MKIRKDRLFTSLVILIYITTVYLLRTFEFSNRQAGLYFGSLGPILIIILSAIIFNKKSR